MWEVYRKLDWDAYERAPVIEKVAFGATAGGVFGLLASGSRLYADGLYNRSMGVSSEDSRVVQTYLKKASSARQHPPPLNPRVEIPRMTTRFALCGALYSLGSGLMQSYRGGGDDWVCAMAGGAAAGTLVAFKFRTFAAGVGGAAFFAIGLGMLHAGMEGFDDEPFIVPPKVSVYGRTPEDNLPPVPNRYHEKLAQERERGSNRHLAAEN